MKNQSSSRSDTVKDRPSLRLVVLFSITAFILCVSHTLLLVPVTVGKSRMWHSSSRPSWTTSASANVIQHTPSGCVSLPLDTPVCAVENVCFHVDLVEFFIAPFGEHQWPWRSEALSGKSQASLEMAWGLFEQRCCHARKQSVGACVRAERLGFSCCRQTYHSRNEPRVLNTSMRFLDEEAVILDTGVNIFHFGHALSKMLQFASFGLWINTVPAPRIITRCSKPRISMGLFTRIYDRKLPEPLRHWLETVTTLLAMKQEASLDCLRFQTMTDIVLETKNRLCHVKNECSTLNGHGATCVKKGFFIQNYEQYYFRASDATQLNKVAEFRLQLPPCPDNSARRRGMLLTRSEGSGHRRLTNAVGVEQIVRLVLGTPLVNVTINSTMTASQQATVCRQHGLIVASHSSQLKNLAVACPCTIVVEVNAMDGSHNPFGVGLMYRSITFVQSTGHTPENYGRPLGSRPLRTFDIAVNLTKFEFDLRHALEKHRSIGCSVF